jgi:hypothetical protein
MMIVVALLALLAVADALWFTNLVDHFDKNNMATYQQFYTVNTTYEDPKATSGVPTFIFLGGSSKKKKKKKPEASKVLHSNT